ncbi:glycosyltransferase [Novosphingopyxis sp. YJ-S2-01]|uniref:glycosyltransferase n=1 Tax=Novosphingopyxis sp. YJ-S2-01 TaxID=2794021 RepID=UPI0018DC92B5|nr:glycosyltransferase [Novosphingopyxis sp. YJ-S2-01]MBH9538454.1 glycosyltransferase [Novosphingopyxis sp. YJ-S2-01]
MILAKPRLEPDSSVLKTAKHLALFLPDMGGGGAERVALSLMEGFVAKGHRVDLVLYRATGLLLPLVPDAVTIHELKVDRQHQAIGPLVRYLREHKPDAIQAMMWPLPLISILARKLSRVSTRVIGAEHTPLSTAPFRLRSRFVRLLTRHAYSAADNLVAVSEGVAQDMCAFIGLSRESVQVIYNPITLPSNLPLPIEARHLWPDGTVRLLAVGELKGEKNFALLLDAFALLRRQINASLLILGEGHLRTELENQVRRNGLERHVVFAGFDMNIWPYFTAADLFVLSSDLEGYGNVLIEAMHAGLPIVSTDCPTGPREILENGRFGTLVPCNDAEAMAEAILFRVRDAYDPEPARLRAASLSGQRQIERYQDIMLG